MPTFLERLDRTEFAKPPESREVISSVTETIKTKDLRWIIWGGSRFGELKSFSSENPTSDLDITTILSPHRHDDPANFLGMLEIANTFNEVSRKFTRSHGVVPVTIATIRLEQAEITMSEMVHPLRKVIPVHWLFYPSLEWAVINEPPQLIKNLTEGVILFGDNSVNQEIQQMLKPNQFSNHLIPLLGGLDWLTDAARVLAANRDGQLPESFLVRLASHNLEYFWKWRIISTFIRQKTGKDLSHWEQMLEFKNLFPDKIWDISTKVSEERQKGPKANRENIILLFKETFQIWPEIVAELEGDKK